MYTSSSIASTMSSMSISITNVSASSLVHRTPMQFRRPTKKSTTRFPSSLRVSAHGHPHGHPQQTTDPSAPPKFLDELRQYAMALHTKEQAPGSGTSCTGLEEDDTTTTRRRLEYAHSRYYTLRSSGKQEAPKEQKPFVPTKPGVLRFLEESKIVYDTFESIVSSDARYECLRNTGLERGPALAQDIEYMVSTWNLTRTDSSSSSSSSSSPGSVYAAMITDLAANNPPAFICHYYNFYFAHTAGGRMIGKQVSDAVLDGWMGAFYKWDGPVSGLLNGVRDSLNEMGAGWSEAEKRASMEETPQTFAMAGSLMRLMAGE